MGRTIRTLLFFFALLTLAGLACMVDNERWMYEDEKLTATADVLNPILTAEFQATSDYFETRDFAELDPSGTPDAPSPAAVPPVDGSPPGGDVRITFSYSGENQSYHTGLRNGTVFYVDREARVVTANEARTFEEPFGSQTSRGSDTVTFSGTYDPVQDGFSGTLTITTEATNSGDSPTSTISYTMSGTLSAVRIDDEWTGTVTGTSRLTQRWPGGEFSEEVSEFPIRWEISGFDTDW